MVEELVTLKKRELFKKLKLNTSLDFRFDDNKAFQTI